MRSRDKNMDGNEELKEKLLDHSMTREELLLEHTHTFIAYYCLEVIYPFAFNNSAINTAPPAAPLNVLCERPMNL